MKDFRLSWVVPLSIVATSGCGWVDSSGRQENRSPGLTELTQLVFESRENVSLGLADEDGNLASLVYSLEAQGGAELNGACIAAGGALAGVSAADFEASCDPAIEQGLEGACEILVIEPELLKSELLVASTPVLRRPIAQQYLLSLQDTDGAASQQSLTLCIASESSAPVAQNDQYDVPYNQVQTFDGMEFDGNCGPELALGVLSNDSDDFDYSEDDANAQQCLVAELLTPPALHEGVFALTSSGGFSYGAGATVGVGMSDSFTYRITDGINFSDTATVTIRITGENTAPVASNPSRTVNEGAVLTLAAAALATDAESGAISLVSVSDPAADPVLGAINWTAAEINYVANQGVFGSDSFDYTVVDPGGATASGVVSVTVNALPTIETVQSTALALTDGDTATRLFSIADNEDAIADLSVTVASSDNSVVTVTQIEELDLGTAENWQVDFTAEGAGTANVTLSVTDTAGGVNADPMVIAVTVAAAPTADPVLASPTLNATVGVPVTFNIDSDALATDSDSNVADLVFSAAPTAAGETITLSAADKSFDFTPSTAGAVTVNVTIEDPDGNTVTGDLTVTVAAAPTADPVLASPTLNATVGVPVTFNIDSDALATDSDSNVADLVFSAAPTAAGETITLSAADKSFDFTPSTAGAVTVNVTIEDPDGNTVTGDLTVTVAAAPTADPVLASPTLNATVGVPVTFNIDSDALATDSDSNVADLVFSAAPTAAGETITLSAADKSFDFTPSTAGAVTVNVTIEDPDGNTVTGDLTVNVTL